MGFRQIVLPFAAGVAVGFLLARHWDGIRAAVEPVARRVARRGREAAAQAREKLWEQRERFEDAVAELRERESLRPADVGPAT